MIVADLRAKVVHYGLGRLELISLVSYKADLLCLVAGCGIWLELLQCFSSMLTAIRSCLQVCVGLSWWFPFGSDPDNDYLLLFPLISSR